MDSTPDLVAERAVLGGMFQYGAEAYFDVADILDANCFQDDTNKLIFKCIKGIFETDSDASIDCNLVICRANDLGYAHIFKKKNEVQHLRSISATKGELNNVRKLSAKLKKLQIANKILEKIEEAKQSIGTITGNESIGEILNLIEGPILDFTNKFSDTQEKTMDKLSNGVDEYIQNLIDNPVESVGISTGYPIFDHCIGGGLVAPEIDVIGARMKTGKSFYADNIGVFVAKTYGIPVMNLDAELTRKQHWDRIIANLSNVPINEVKTGQFTKDSKYGNGAEKTKRVLEAKEQLKSMPYYYDCIANRPFEDTLSMLRRWLNKEVGFDADGKAKPCLIIYDYIKLLSSEGMSASMHEFQLLGFLITSLKNFLIRYHVPCLAFCQLNRDAIDKETTDVVMGSDRILMFCSSFAIFKEKTREEIAEDGIKNGNMKLIPKIARNGPAMQDGNYICVQFDRDYGRLLELKTKDDIELDKEEKKSFEVKDVDNDPDEEIPFGE